MARVIVWKNAWLPSSETFIRNQTAALSRYSFTAVGLRRLESLLSREDDIILGGGGKVDIILTKLFPIIGILPAVNHYFQMNRPDLLHVHFAGEARGIRHTAKKLKIPMVITVHGNDVTEAPNLPGLKGILYRTQTKRALRSAAKVIAVSEFTAKKVILMGARSEDVVVHHIGMPIPELLPKITPEYDLVFVGRFVPMKGLPDLLEAVGRIHNTGRQLRVAFVGGGALEPKLRQQARDIGLNINFMGFLPAGDIPRILASSKVFVAPSRTTSSGHAEGFGMVFLEAAAQEVPVISYRHGGIPEAVADGETGFLVPEGDIAALTKKITWVLDHPSEAEAAGKAGRRRVIEQFNIVDQTRKLEIIYDGVRDRP